MFALNVLTWREKCQHSVITALSLLIKALTPTKMKTLRWVVLFHSSLCLRYSMWMRECVGNENHINHFWKSSNENKTPNSFSGRAERNCCWNLKSSLKTMTIIDAEQLLKRQNRQFRGHSYEKILRKKARRQTHWENWFHMNKLLCEAHL